MSKTFAETLQILSSLGGKARISLEKSATVRIGANGGEGYLAVYSKNAKQSDLDGAPSFVMEGETARLWVGTKGLSGEIFMFPMEFNQGDPKRATIHLNAQRAELSMGGGGKAGHIRLFPSAGTRTKAKTASIHLDGNAGDIILKNGDTAEDFDVDESNLVDPGTVVVIGDDTKLRRCSQSYDKRVAGVIAGAGECKPGIILGRNDSEQKRLPLALMGRVFCKADAEFDPIDLGDLLTTSPTPGHAMKAGDPLSAFGAIIGKALSPLRTGQGLVQVLVALQ